MDRRSNGALLLFARQPIAGRVKTRLVPALTPEEASILYGCMLRDIITKAANLSGVEKYLFYDGGAEAAEYFAALAPSMRCLPQMGNDLGERMAGAFQELFARDHGTVVIIGSDSPDLPIPFIEEGFARLDGGECDAVFGPAEDGGYYLVGMKKLNLQLFMDIPWGTDNVLKTTLMRAATSEIAVSLLPTWHDVDRQTDLLRPELLDERNGAPLTRQFLLKRDQSHAFDKL